MIGLKNILLSASLSMTLLLSLNAHAQWTNHYQKLDDFGHHVYLEQHELPILAQGITDPAPAPNGKHIAFSSKGWLWLLDIESGVAMQLTNANGTDARPRWSPDSKHIAFVRDFGNDTAVVIKDLKSGQETFINTSAIELDPEFSADGSRIYYSSGASGSMDLYQQEIANLSSKNTDDKVGLKLTDLRQIERNIRRVANKNAILYLHGAGAHRVLRQHDFTDGTDTIVQAQTLTYHLTSDTHPSQGLLVYSAPIDNDYHLFTMDLNDTRVSQRLTDHGSFALTPAFSADGNAIYFVELDDNRQFHLMKINTHGGKASKIKVKQWKYKKALGTLNVSIENEQGQTVAARVSIISEDGHPVSTANSATFDDPQTGRSYFYIDGKETFTLPVGKYLIEAVRGPMTMLVSANVELKNAKTTNTKLILNTLWDSEAAGYTSADFHVHLNGDGHHRATHKDALLLMKGEDLNYLAPMSWNRWERKIDKPIVGKVSTSGKQSVVQGQEVRSHFHGHVGLLNVKEPFSPWFFGPSNPALGDTNLSNADVFAYANSVGAFGTYVHPIANDGDPFNEEGVNSIPLELLADGILQKSMGLEIVCAWTSSLGTAEVWYRLLNIGRPVAGISGTDGWVDFHRTPAMGTARAYVRALEGSAAEDPVVEGAIAGRSFLSTGPALMFALNNGAKPGDVTTSGKQSYTLSLASTNKLEVVEIIVNGQVVQTLEAVGAGETKSYTGELNLPSGGWVAARAYAAEKRADSWPTMHARPFAHSSPIWIGHIGSTESSASKAAAQDLLLGLNAANARAKEAYGERPMPKLYKRFDDAKKALEKF